MPGNGHTTPEQSTTPPRVQQALRTHVQELLCNGRGRFGSTGNLVSPFLLHASSAQNLGPESSTILQEPPVSPVPNGKIPPQAVAQRLLEGQRTKGSHGSKKPTNPLLQLQRTYFEQHLNLPEELSSPEQIDTAHTQKKSLETQAFWAGLVAGVISGISLARSIERDNVLNLTNAATLALVWRYWQKVSPTITNFETSLKPLSHETRRAILGARTNTELYDRYNTEALTPSALAHGVASENFSKAMKIGTAVGTLGWGAKIMLGAMKQVSGRQ